MKPLEDRRYAISEVSELTGVPVHVLRYWERRLVQLKPKRDRANRRYYSAADIEIVRRIKHLVRHEKMTAAGAGRRVSQEIQGEGRPRTRKEAIDLLDHIEGEVRRLLGLLDSD